MIGLASKGGRSFRIQFSTICQSILLSTAISTASEIAVRDRFRRSPVSFADPRRRRFQFRKPVAAVSGQKAFVDDLNKLVHRSRWMRQTEMPDPLPALAYFGNRKEKIALKVDATDFTADFEIVVKVNDLLPRSKPAARKSPQKQDHNHQKVCPNHRHFPLGQD